MGGFMKYAAEMVPGDMMYVPSSIKTGPSIPELMRKGRCI
jgi:uncharacterized RmlC-like cupin family protein